MDALSWQQLPNAMSCVCISACLTRSFGRQAVRNGSTRGSEIKFVVTLDIAQLQRERDQLARDYRELDTAIQGVNWSTDLVE